MAERSFMNERASSILARRQMSAQTFFLGHMAKKPTAPPASAEPTIKRGNVKDYLPAEINPNKSNPRGVPAIVNSLHQFGAGRSIVVDRDGEAVAGSHTIQAAIDAGITDVIEVTSDGDALIVHKRRDLDLTTDAKARGLQIADNRASELGYLADEELLAEMLTQIGAEDSKFVLAAGYDEFDLKALMFELEPHFDPVDESEQPRLDQKKPIICPHCGMEFTPE